MESNLISLITTGRRNILELMEHNGYDISEYSSFTRSEVIALDQYKQLDMILHKPADNTNIYIRFSLDAKVTYPMILNLVDDLFYDIRDGAEKPMLNTNDILQSDHINRIIKVFAQRILTFPSIRQDQ